MEDHILDRTTNFLELYMHHVGKTETPADFHVWACLSLLAAAVGNRVWFEKLKGQLYPNLYVFLIGPSGIGKEDAATKVANFAERHSRICYKRMRTTAPNVLDTLDAPRKAGGSIIPQSSRLYLVSPELAFHIGTGPRADDLIKTMSELYGGKTMDEGTRTHGQIHIERPCINWLACSTREWLFQAVSREAIMSGFFARIFYVEAEYDLNKRFVDGIYPADWDEVVEHLHARLTTLTHVEGQFTLAADAQEIRATWYGLRPSETDIVHIPQWKRHDDMILKVAMLMSLAEDIDLMIKRHHYEWAKKFVLTLTRGGKKLVKRAAVTPEGEALELVRGTIQKFGEISRSRLLKAVGNYGITKDPLNEIIATLAQQKVIKTQTVVGGATIYKWIDNRSLKSVTETIEEIEELES